MGWLQEDQHDFKCDWDGDCAGVGYEPDVDGRVTTRTYGVIEIKGGLEKIWDLRSDSENLSGVTTAGYSKKHGC